MPLVLWLAFVATSTALVYALLADKIRRRTRTPLILCRPAQAGGVTFIGMGAFTATPYRATP